LVGFRAAWSRFEFGKLRILTLGDLKIEEGAQSADVALTRLRSIVAVSIFDELDDLFRWNVPEDSRRESDREILEDAFV
jgi:hypothetical protein